MWSGRNDQSQLRIATGSRIQRNTAFHLRRRNGCVYRFKYKYTHLVGMDVYRRHAFGINRTKPDDNL